MNGLPRNLRAHYIPSLISRYGGIKSLCRFSSQSDEFSGGRRFREQGSVLGDSEKQSSLPNTGRISSSLDPNASTFNSFNEIKSGLSRTGGIDFSTLESFNEIRSGLLKKEGDGFSAPNAPPTFKNPMRSSLPNTEGSGFSALSSSNFTQTSLLKENFRNRVISKDLEFVRGVIQEDEGRKNSMFLSHFHRPNLETNADIIHIKMLRNNTFVTVTDSKGNVKCKATSGSLPDLKGGRKMTNYTADATAENIGRRAKAMGLKSVVVKVNGFTHFSKKKKAIIAFRDGFTNSKADMNPIVYIEDTTRKAHNGCRLPRKRRV